MVLFFDTRKKASGTFFFAAMYSAPYSVRDGLCRAYVQYVRFGRTAECSVLVHLLGIQICNYICTESSILLYAETLCQHPSILMPISTIARNTSITYIYTVRQKVTAFTMKSHAKDIP